MSLFGDLTFKEFVTALRASNAAFGKVDPPNGWTALDMSDLGLDNQNGTNFTSRNGRGKAIVLQQDDEIIVAFRGSDKFGDVKDYGHISVTKSYSRQFEPLLKAVAKYEENNDLTTTFTGISLGGAVTNIIADKASNQWGGQFKDARFIGIASPYLSDHKEKDLFNFGMANDLVYHVVDGSWNKPARSMATEHVFIYGNSNFFLDNLSDSFMPHRVGKLNDAIRSLADLTVAGGEQLVDVLHPDSWLIFDQTKETVRAAARNHPDGSVLTIIGQSRADSMRGADHKNPGSDMERFYGMGGNDVIIARRGNDELHGGSGSDRLTGGEGRDILFGDGGDDFLYLENNKDRATGGSGVDRFIIRDMLPFNDHGIASRGGNVAASVFIEDFVAGEDRINLTAIDGNLMTNGHKPLHFADVKYEVFDSSDGLSDLELGYVNDKTPGSVTIYEDGNGDTILIINRDSDRARELEIVLTGELGNIKDDLVF